MLKKIHSQVGFILKTQMCFNTSKLVNNIFDQLIKKDKLIDIQASTEFENAFDDITSNSQKKQIKAKQLNS